MVIIATDTELEHLRERCGKIEKCYDCVLAHFSNCYNIHCEQNSDTLKLTHEIYGYDLGTVMKQ